MIRSVSRYLGAVRSRQVLTHDASQAQSGSAGWAGAGGAAEGVVSLSPPPQQPTRSLWVGNLDPKTSPAELQDVFAPYGAIESLRLIPEKVRCRFKAKNGSLTAPIPRLTRAHLGTRNAASSILCRSRMPCARRRMF